MRKEPTKMKMAEIVKEYKQITGKTIKTTRAVAERRLTGARITIPKKSDCIFDEPSALVTSKTPSVTSGVFVGKHQYPSFTAAFRALKLANGSMAVLRRVRKELKAKGEATVEGHEFRMGI